VPVIGYLSSLTQADSVRFDAAFRRGLSEMGYAEGQNVWIEYRWITDSYGALPAMAADLVQHQVAMLSAFGPPAVLAAKAATATIPIVFVTGADPIKFGFVDSFNRPGGNVTGIWMVLAVLAQKRLQLTRELLPRAELVALLINPTSPTRSAPGRLRRGHNATIEYRWRLGERERLAELAAVSCMRMGDGALEVAKCATSSAMMSLILAPSVF
jgi:ABC-type uncharacterized transport system, periplasmic component